MTGQPMIMIVDDEWLIRELMESVFTMNKYRVLLASNGEQALEIATATPPDVVLLDVRMPGMSGYEVCEALKSNPITQHVKVIMMSGLEGTRMEKAEAKAAGADDFINRSISTQALVKYVRNLLEAND